MSQFPFGIVFKASLREEEMNNVESLKGWKELQNDLLVQPIMQQLSGRLRCHDCFLRDQKASLIGRIPYEVLHLIIEKLSFVDLISFASAIELAHRYPLLMAVASQKDFHYPGLQIFNIFDNKTYKFEIPEMSKPYSISGSSLAGWVTKRHNEVHDVDKLLHPFTRKVIDLHHLPYHYCEKIITSTSSLPSSDDFIAMAISVHDYLSYCRPGRKNDSWIQVVIKDRCRDLAFYKGKFYALGFYGGVHVVEGLDEGEGIPPRASVFTAGDGTYLWRKSSLVGSSNALFKVLQWRKGFEVYKLDCNGPTWVQVKDLGDVSFFVGNHSNSFSVSAFDFSGLKGNCVYYILDGLDYHTCGYGVFSLKDGTTKIFPPKDSVPCSGIPIWYMF